MDSFVARACAWSMLACSFLHVLPAQALGLMDAYALALANDPVLRAAVHEHAASQENLVIGRAGLLPRLGLQYTYTPYNVQEIGYRPTTGAGTSQERDFSSYAGSLTLEQPLLDYAAWSRYRQARSQAQAADERLRGKSQELAVRVLEAYNLLLLAQEHLKLAVMQTHVYDSQLALNTRLFELGEGIRTDITETGARRELALAQQIDAQDLVESARNELELLLGHSLEGDSLQALNDDFSELPLVPATLAEWQALAQERNPGLAAMRQDVAQLALEIERQRAGHLPRVNLYASRNQAESDTINSYRQRYHTDSAGVQVVLPLYAGGGVSASRRQAVSNHEKGRDELVVQTRATLIELRRQFNICASAGSRLRAYGRAVEAAGEDVEATRKSVAGGMRANPDVLDAEERFIRARRDQAEARHAYLNAWIRLRYYAGILSEDDLRAVAARFTP